MLHKFTCRFFRGVARFRKSERGTSVVTMALAMSVLVGAVGLSFDAGRAYMIKDRLGAAVDSAALAGGRSLDVGGSGNYAAQITKYFKSNIPDGFMGASVATPQVRLLAGGNQVEVVATAVVPSTLMQVLDIGDITISAKATVARATRGMEVALVLDNSASMDGGKMTDLRDSAQTLLDIMYGDQTSVENLHVAVVPFTGRTNLRGQDAIHPIDPVDEDFVCLNVRNGVHGRNDATPDFKPFEHYDGTHAPTGGFLGSFMYEFLICPAAEILPLTQDKSEVEAALDAMDAKGCTRYDTGTAWGWRTLSPDWQGYWADTAGDVMTSLPLAYSAQNMDKAIVVMTDGQATSGSGCGDSTTDQASEQHFAQTCSMMKAAGITVYTIVFDLDDTTTEDLFRDCASGEERYFKAGSADLEDAFAEIATDLTTLRLVN